MENKKYEPRKCNRCGIIESDDVVLIKGKRGDIVCECCFDDLYIGW